MLEIRKERKFLYKCKHEMIKEQEIMNGITSKSSSRANQTESTRPAKTVETAGSLAMNSAFDYFSVNTYDSFSSSNPFSVNYAQYADCTEGTTVAYSGGFLSDFSNAVSTLSTGGFSGGATASCGTSSGGCSSGGGFTSFC